MRRGIGDVEGEICGGAYGIEEIDKSFAIWKSREEFIAHHCISHRRVIGMWRPPFEVLCDGLVLSDNPRLSQKLGWTREWRVEQSFEWSGPMRGR